MEKMREDSTSCSFFPSTSEIKYQTVNMVQICYVHRIVGVKLWLRKWIKQIVYFIYRAPLQIVMWFTSTDFVTKTKNDIYDDTQTHTHTHITTDGSEESLLTKTERINIIRSTSKHAPPQNSKRLSMISIISEISNNFPSNVQ